MTFMLTVLALALDHCWLSVTNRLARMISNVVMPNKCLGLYTPAFSKIDVNSGTRLLTGLLMIRKHASGQNLAQAVANVATIFAFSNAPPMFSIPKYPPQTLAFVSK